MRAPLVSVIVPIFNLENLVSRCIESIVNQNYTKLEIILVNDGSTDSSGKICDSYSELDERIVVLHKPNGGLSDARNFGIRSSTGKLITCIDGDDYVSPTLISNLVKPFLEQDVDLSVGGFSKVSPTETSDMKGSSSDYEVITNEVALQRLFYQKGLTTSAWGKLYRRHLFDAIEYPVGQIHEDLPVTYRIIAECDKVAVASACDYFYVQHPQSITATGSYRKRLPAINFASEAVDFTNNQFPHLAQSAKVRLFMECVYLISQANHLSDYRRVDPSVKAKIKYLRWEVISSEAPKAQKALAWLAMIEPSLVWAAIRCRTVLSNRRFNFKL